MSDAILDRIAQMNASGETMKEAIEASTLPPPDSVVIPKAGIGGTDLILSSKQTLRDGFEADALKVISSQANPEENMFRWQAATEYAKNFGITPYDAFNNLDRLSEEYFTSKPLLKTLPKAIADSFTAQKLSLELGSMLSKYMGHGNMFDLAGSFGGQEFSNKELYADAMKIRDKMMALQVDNMPRAWYETWAKTIAGVVPYTFDVVKAGAIATGATALAGATLGVSGLGWFEAMKAVIATGTRFARGAEIMRGLNFLEMTERGVPENEAKTWANVSALGQSAIEALIGIESSIGKALGSSGVKTLAELVVTKLNVSGLMASTAAKFAGKMTINTLSEMLEEGGQAFVGGISTMLAQSSSEIAEHNPMISKDMWDDVAEGLYGALITAPFLGLGPEIIAAVKDKKALASLAGAATSMDKEDFAQTVVGSGLLSGVGVSEDAQREMGRKIYDQQIALQIESQATAKEVARQKAKKGLQPNDQQVGRLKNGSLYYNEEVTVDQGTGAQTVSVLYGDPEEPTTIYGDIQIQKRDGKVIITGGEIEYEHVNIAGEMIEQIAARNPGLEVVLDENMELDSAIAGGYEGFVERNGSNIYGKGELAEVSVEKQRISRQIEAAGIDSRTAPVFFAHARMTAYVSGKSDLEVLKEIKVEGVDVDLSGKSISAGFYSEAKGIISLARGLPWEQDVDTARHEMVHFFRAYVSKHNPNHEDLKAMERILGVKDGKWTNADDERLQQMMQDRVASRELSDPKARNFLDQLTKFIKGVYEAFKEQISPEARRIMDSWLDSMRFEEAVEGMEYTKGGPMNKRSVHPDIQSEEKAFEDAKPYIEKAAAQTGKDMSYYNGIVKELWVVAEAAARNWQMFQNQPNPFYKHMLSSIFNNSWMVDPVVVAYLRRAANMDLSQEEEDLLSMSQWGTLAVVTPLQSVVDLVDGYSDEAKAAFAAAAKGVGYTNDFGEAGFVVPDGKMLNLSGGQKGRRGLEHAQLDYGSKKRDPSERVYDFINYGAIRVDFEGGIVEMGAKPTREQWKTIVDGLTVTGNGYAFVEMRTDDGRLGRLTINVGNKRTLSFPARFYDGESAKVLQQESSMMEDLRSVVEPVDSTDSENFKAWFNDSKVVDENGKPLVMYHGSRDEIEEFDDKKGRKNDAGWLGRGFYFTTKPEIAGQYADAKRGDAGRNVMPVYLSIQNPYMATIRDKEEGMIASARRGKDGNDSPEWAYKRTEELISQGYDGVILDYSPQGFSGSKEIVAFKSSQVKSVFNKGAWSGDDGRLLFSVVEQNDNLDKIKAQRGATTPASEYKSFDDWMASMYANLDTMSEKDKAWYKARYDHAHSPEHAKRQYEKRGSFIKYLREGQNFFNFIYHINKALHGKDRYKDEASEQRADRIEAAISKTPELFKLVDAMNKSGARPSKTATDAFMAMAGKHEALYKYLYALVTTDEALAHEALDDLGSIPELVKRDLTGSEEITIADQEEILDALADDELRDKVKNGTVTIKELDEYIKRQTAEQKEEYEAYIKEFSRQAREKVKGAKDEERKKGEARLKAYKEKVKALNAVKRMKREMERITAIIFRPPSDRVAYFQASLIKAIQEALRSRKPISKEDLPMSQSFAAMYSEAWNKRLDSFINIINFVTSGGTESIPLEFAKEIAAFMLDLAREGRIALRDAELQFGERTKLDRLQLISEFMSGKYFKVQVAPNSEEERKRKKELDRLARLFDADRPDAWFRKYLGKKAAEILFDESVEARSQKLRNYDRRVKPVITLLKDKSLAASLDKQYVFENAFGENGDSMTVTGRDLVGMRLYLGTESEFNESQRKAFIYGNLFSAIQKDSDGTLTEEGQARANLMMESKYQEKLDLAMKFVSDNITAEQEELAKAMLVVMNNDEDWFRFAKSMILLTNKEPKKERFYFPIVRQGSFEEGEDTTIDALKDYGIQAHLDGGMAIERRDMDARNHKQVKYDAIDVFFTAIQKQEHLTEVGPYIKRLRGIFKSGVFSETLRKSIEDSIGRKALDYIDKQIDTLTNPTEFNEKASGAEALNFWRGAVVISNLSWRLSTVLMQLLTSPLPGYAEAPLQMLPASIKGYTNPLKFVEEVEEKSMQLKYRRITPEHGTLQKRKLMGVATGIEKFALTGMKGIDFADRISVAIVWEAVRMKNIDAGKSEAQAILAADKFIMQTQPTSEESDRAPMYRDPNAFKQLVLQFTQPLNVIWNNIRNDIPQAARDQEYGKIVGFITAYAMSGLAIGVVAALRGMGPDDPDDDKWMRYWIHASTSQFTDSIPFIGNIVTSLTGYAIVGDNNSWLRTDRNMPALDLLARGAESLFRKEGPEYGKFVLNMAKGMGMMAGAPVRAAEEYYRLVAKAFGVEEQ